MDTRRDILTGIGGACAGILCWTVGWEIADELRSTDVRYVLFRNATESQQSVKVLFESDGEPIFWETYELEPEQVVEFDGFDRVGDYRVFTQWGDSRYSQELETGTRAVAIVLAAVGDGDLLFRDVPFSSLSQSQRSVGRTQNDSTE